MKTVEELQRRVAELEQLVEHLNLVQTAQITALAVSAPAAALETADHLQALLNMLPENLHALDTAQSARWVSTVQASLKGDTQGEQRQSVPALGLALLGLATARVASLAGQRPAMHA